MFAALTKSVGSLRPRSLDGQRNRSPVTAGERPSGRPCLVGTFTERWRGAGM